LFISVINQIDAQNFCFTISLFHASTCFEHNVLIIRRSKLYYTASGIIAPIGGRLVHRSDDTRGCVTQFWPPDDKHMCSKHVEAWNKLIVKLKFCASSWLITEINILRCTVSKTSKKKKLSCVLTWTKTTPQLCVCMYIYIYNTTGMTKLKTDSTAAVIVLYTGCYNKILYNINISEFYFLVLIFFYSFIIYVIYFSILLLLLLSSSSSSS